MIQPGENPDNIHITGSPETDVLLSDQLPTFNDVKRYDIDFEEYYIFLLASVTTEIKQLKKHIKDLIKFATLIKKNIIWIYPNNDEGSEIIIKELISLNNHKNIKIFESLRFEYYVSLLKNASMIVGNSSSGVREAPLLGIPCINIGSRQNGRVQNKLIFESGYSFDEIVSTYNSISSLSFNKNDSVFKPTNVNENILKVIDEINIKDIPIQKIFYEE